jgi:prevent-host-death family protein
MKVTASKLRENIYSILDEVLETGVPVEITRKGRTLRIISYKPASRLKLRKRDYIVGDPDDLIHIDWLQYWTELKR